LRQALSDFADYVQKQQALRRPPGQEPAVLEDHDELSILDELGLSDDTKPHIRLKTLLIDPAEDNVTALAEHITERLAEGHGEVLGLHQGRVDPCSRENSSRAGDCQGGSQNPNDKKCWRRSRSRTSRRKGYRAEREADHQATTGERGRCHRDEDSSRREWWVQITLLWLQRADPSS
jgi:hypothetical protein